MKHERMISAEITVTYDDETGSVEFYSDNGILMPDWMERAKIKRDTVKSIRVAEGKVRLHHNACGKRKGKKGHHYLMFGGLKNLEKIDLTGFDTSEVDSMNHMFADCHKLKTLDFGSLDTSNVSDTGWMFYNCYSLEHVDNLKTSCEMYTPGMFCGCRSLEDIDMSNFSRSWANNDMSYMFTDCSQLISVDLSEFDMSYVSFAERMFANCTNLLEVHMGEEMEATGGSLQEMFDGCSNLETVTMPWLTIDPSDWYILGWTGWQIRLDNIFRGCPDTVQISDPVQVSGMTKWEWLKERKESETCTWEEQE